MAHTCSKSIRVGDSWSGGYRPCGKPAKVEKDGKHYCGVHDPQKRIDRDEKWNAEQKAERIADAQRDAAKAEQERRAALYPAMLEALKAVLKARWMFTLDWANESDYAPIRDAAEKVIAAAEGRE